jgi:hypothetical protein
MNYNIWLTLLLIFTGKKEEEQELYIPYYSVFDLNPEQDFDLKKKDSYYTVICKSYDTIKQYGIEILK